MAAYNQLPIQIICTDIESKVVFTNNYICDLLQVSKEEVIGKKIYECIDPEFHKDLKNQLGKITNADSESFWEFKLRDQWFSIRLLPRKFNDDIIGHILLIDNINQKKQYVLEIEETVRNYETLFNSAPLGIVLIRDDIILNANQKFVNIYEYERTEEIVGKSISELQAQDVRELQLVRGKRRLEGKSEITSYESIGLKKDDTEFPIQVEVTVISLSDGDAIFAFVQDISEKKETEINLGEKENRYRLVSEATFEALIISMEGKMVEANDAFASMWGYDSKEDMVGKTPYDLATPESAEIIMQNIREGVETPYEFSGLKKDGTSFYVESVARNFSYKGKNARVTGMRDITDRKLAENALRESENKFRTLIENSPNDILTIDRNGSILFINRVSPGRRVEDVLGKNLIELIDDPKSKKTMQDAIVQIFDTQEPLVVSDIRIRDLILLAHFSPLKINDETLNAMIILMDITDIKVVEKKLRESEEKFRILFENAPEAVVVFNTETLKFEQFNQNAIDLFKMSKNEIEQVGPIELSPRYQPNGKLTAEAVPDQIKLALQGSTDTFEWLHLDSHGNEIPCEVRLVQLPPFEQHLFRASITDITERKLSEQAMKESEAKYRSIFANAPVAFSEIEMTEALEYLQEFDVILDDLPNFFKQRPEVKNEFESRIIRTAYNKKFVDLLEIPDEKILQVPNTMTTYFTEAAIADGNYRKSLLDLIENFENPYYEIEYETKIKTYRENIKNVIIHRSLLKDPGTDKTIVLNSVIDITAMKQAEAEIKNTREHLYQIQKMEAIGRLAVGIAHDFNNMLAIIQSHCDLLLVELLQTDPIYKDILNIQAATENAAKLTKQLLTFGKKYDLRPKKVNLNDAVYAMSSMIERIIPIKIQLALDLDDTISPVFIDPTQIGQVIVNLITNAVEAMPTGGKLTISTQNMIPEGRILLSVTDTGTGMTFDIQKHIFEPFYTTKAEKGTGLGLATSYGIIQQSGGIIEVESTLGEGSKFIISLPTVEIESY
ncbi:MAG: PAS domain-containing sensor histidine kinase [Candidatus Kariarchaeaceae archaeon]|jgi:PAS domain S-box-containing protein